MKTLLSFVSVLGIVSCRNVISLKKEATGFLRTERDVSDLAKAYFSARKSNILTSNGDESYLEKMNLHATRLELVTDEDWEKRGTCMYETLTNHSKLELVQVVK